MGRTPGVVASAEVTVGVDIGGSKVQTVALDASDEVVASTRMRLPTTGDRAAVVEVIIAGVFEVADEAGIDLGDVEGVGVGSPGAVIDGTVGQAGNVPGWWERFRLADLVGQRVRRPVRVVNDVTAAAVAEHRLGAGRDCDNLLMVSVDSGVGGGLILGGRVFEGSFGAAGEFGHTIVERGGAVCPCGRRGCVEAYTGRRALERSVRRALDTGSQTSLFRISEQMGREGLTSAVFRAAYDEGDPLVADLVDWGAEALGKGIASAVNLLDVERVVVGGGLANALGPPFLIRVEAAARPALFLQPPKVEILPAELGGRGGAIGAALFARGFSSSASG